MSALRRIDCAVAEDRAPFFVLGALDTRETAEVRDHLASCSQPHPEYLELGGVVPYLADLVEPVDGGPELRRRVMDAIAADVRAQERDDHAAERLVASFGGPSRPSAVDAARPPLGAGDEATASPGPEASRPDTAVAEGAVTTVPPFGPASAGVDGARTDRPPTLWVDEPGVGGSVTAPTSVAERAASRGFGPGWLLSAAAVLLIVVLGAWNIGLQLQGNDTARRADELRAAIAVTADPGARIARLTGSEAAPDAHGIAAFRPDGTGAMIVRGLPAAPSDKTYQAWFLHAGGAASAGLVQVGPDGLLVVTGLRSRDPIQGVALTLEARGGRDQPSETPRVVGTLSA